MYFQARCDHRWLPRCGYRVPRLYSASGSYNQRLLRCPVNHLFDPSRRITFFLKNWFREFLQLISNAFFSRIRKSLNCWSSNQLCCRQAWLRYFSPTYFPRDLSLLRRFMVDSLTLSIRGVPLESSGLRFSRGRSMNIRLFLKIYRWAPASVVSPSGEYPHECMRSLFHSETFFFITSFDWNNFRQNSEIKTEK